MSSRQTGPEPEAWLAARRDHDGNLDVLRMPDGTGFAWELSEVEADAVIAQVQSDHRKVHGQSYWKMSYPREPCVRSSGTTPSASDERRRAPDGVQPMMHHPIRAGVPAAVAALAALALTLATGGAAEQTRAPAQTTKQAFKVETYAKGLAYPWSLAFLPDGRLLVTERQGRMRLVAKNGGLSAPLGNVPEVHVTRQGGLLDVTLAPDFASSSLVYFSYAEPRQGGGSATTVARAKLVVDGDSGRLDDVRILFRQQPAGFGAIHFGSRLVFARDGNLFVTVGERGEREKAQDLGNHYGKVLRLRSDGTVPPDNPFVGKAGARPEIWSYGHRNVQSAALHPVSGKLWTIEHGARGGDELNIPLAGRNHGWPVITYGRNYTGERIGEGTAKAGMEQPVYYWDPSIAPSGMAFYTGALFPEWKGNLFVGALAGAALHRLVLDGETVVGEERLLGNLGERIRDVRAGPDGAIWLLTDNPQGRILRVVPAG